MKIKLRYVFLNFIIFFSSIIAHPLYANEAFDFFKDAISGQATKIEMQQLCQKYKGERIDGRGYVVSIGHDIEGNFMVNMSTKKNFAASDSINVVIYLRKYLAGKKLAVKVGHKARFIGIFEEMRMGTIIVKEGVVKY